MTDLQIIQTLDNPQQKTPTTTVAKIEKLRRSSSDPSISNINVEPSNDDEKLFLLTGYFGRDYYAKRPRFRWTQMFLPENNTKLLVVFLVRASGFKNERDDDNDDDEDAENATSLSSQLLAFQRVIKAFEGTKGVEFLVVVWDKDEIEKNVNLQEFSQKFGDFQEFLMNSIASVETDKTPSEVACDFLAKKFLIAAKEILGKEDDTVHQISVGLSDPKLFTKITNIVHTIEVK